VRPAVLAERLRDSIATGEAVLFTGAGFSVDARDRSGRPIPTGPELADELFDLCFPGEQRDESGLTDLFYHALSRCRSALADLLSRRMTVDPRSVPEYYRLWLAAPWRHAYTLNVDDLERAVALRFGVSRRVRVVSALRGHEHTVATVTPAQSETRKRSRPELVFAHLNGVIDDGPEGVTFSPPQYGGRLATRDFWYEALVDDLRGATCVFVGTRLDESPLWQHLAFEDRRGSSARSPARPSLLVTPELSRARRTLLADVGIEWVPCTAEEFAHEVLAAIVPPVAIDTPAAGSDFREVRGSGRA
jgi:hypothetical protein